MQLLSENCMIKCLRWESISISMHGMIFFKKKKTMKQYCEGSMTKMCWTTKARHGKQMQIDGVLNKLNGNGTMPIP